MRQESKARRAESVAEIADKTDNSKQNLVAFAEKCQNNLGDSRNCGECVILLSLPYFDRNVERKRLTLANLSAFERLRKNTTFNALSHDFAGGERVGWR